MLIQHVDGRGVLMFVQFEHSRGGEAVELRKDLGVTASAWLLQRRVRHTVPFSRRDVTRIDDTGGRRIARNRSFREIF